MKASRRVASDGLILAVGAFAVLLGVASVKEPLLTIGAFGVVAMVAVAVADPTLPAVAWLLVAPFVNALEPGSPLVVFTMAFHRFLLPVVGLSTMLGQSIRRQLRLLTSERVLLLFLAYALVSLVMSWRGSTGTIPASEAQRTFLFAYVVPFGALLLAHRIPLESHKRILQALALMAGIIALGGIVQSVTGAGIFPGAARWLEHWEPRAVGSLGNPAVSGYVVHVGVFAAAYLVARHAGLRIPGLVVVAAGGVFTILTYTRSVWLALAAGAVSIAWFYRRARLWVVVALVAAAGAFTLNVGGFVDTAFLEERAGNQENVEGRFAFGSTGFRMFEDSPIVGQGFGTYDIKAKDFAVGFGTVGASVAVADTSHNTFLTILAELGLVGFGLYLTALWLGLRRGLSVLRRKVPGADRLKVLALFAGVVSYGISANLIDMRFFSFAIALFWFNVGLIDASARGAEARPKAGSSP